MPFAPSILEEDFNKFIINPKKQKPYFMTMSFDTSMLKKPVLLVMHLTKLQDHN